jgi:hypothetical protein
MITAAAVFAGFKSLWDASGILAQRVPGGLWEGFPKADAVVPYASAKITQGERTWTSGLTLYAFTVEITVYSTAGRSDAGLIEAAMHVVFRQGRVGTLVVAGATRAVQMFPAPGEARDEGQHDAKDVKVTAGRWAVLLEGPE